MYLSLSPPGFADGPAVGRPRMNMFVVGARRKNEEISMNEKNKERILVLNNPIAVPLHTQRPLERRPSHCRPTRIYAQSTYPGAYPFAFYLVQSSPVPVMT